MSSIQNINSRPPFKILSAFDPDTMRSLLFSNRAFPFLILRRPPSPAYSRSGYYIEFIHNTRAQLHAHRLFTGHPISRNQWFYHDGLYWPDDLSFFPGPWKYPLTFSFSRLTILDIDVQDAVYWLLPILAAIESHAPLRRIILRGCVDYDSHPIPFPFDSFDTSLHPWPDAKLLLAWAESEDAPFIAEWRARLPTLNAENRIAILYSDGPNGMSSLIQSHILITHILFKLFSLQMKTSTIWAQNY